MFFLMPLLATLDSFLWDGNFRGASAVASHEFLGVYNGGHSHSAKPSAEVGFDQGERRKCPFSGGARMRSSAAVTHELSDVFEGRHLRDLTPEGHWRFKVFISE